MAQITDKLARLHEMAESGLRKRYHADLWQPARIRLDHELEIIERSGFVSDFLAVAEMAQFTRERQIPCRLIGAACGCITCYCLGGSDVDPLCRDLLFERFCDPLGKRDVMFSFQIATDQMELVTDFAADRDGRDDTTQRLFLSEMPLLAVVPYRIAQHLGTSQSRPFELSEIPTKTNGHGDDPQTFDWIKSGDIAGVYQLDQFARGVGLCQLAPSCVDDLSAITAIATIPIDGPDLTQAFIEKTGDVRLSGLDRREVSCVLSNSRGLILYQEQVMLLLQRLGGLDLSEAYLLVRAAAKRKTATVENYRCGFMQHAQDVLGTHTAKEAFDQLIKAATYVCCQSHHLGQAMTTYQAAYLKHHFPAEFAEVMDGTVV